MKYGINGFIGNWVSEDGYKLEIIKENDTSALISMYSPDVKAIIRPYFNNKPSLEMPSQYDEYEGILDIYLWGIDKGFEINLIREEEYMLDDLQRESLVPTYCRREEDEFMDQYWDLFGQLKHYTRIK